MTAQYLESLTYWAVIDRSRMQSFRRDNVMTLRRQTLLVFVLMASAFNAAFGQERVLQTNSGSGNIHLIDPATHKVVGEITGVPVNHGAAGSPDGKRLYVSSEAEQ